MYVPDFPIDIRASRDAESEVIKDHLIIFLIVLLKQKK